MCQGDRARFQSFSRHCPRPGAVPGAHLGTGANERETRRIFTWTGAVLCIILFIERLLHNMPCGTRIVLSQEESIPVGEVARRAGVTTATVNFYVREGLLPERRKTARTRALYPASSVARIEHIRALQAQGLPLRLIRRVLDSAEPAAALGLEAVSERPARQPTPARIVGVDSFLSETRLDEAVFAEMVEAGLLRSGSGTGAGEPAFNRQDIAAGRALAALLASGVPMRLLVRHGEYEPLARAEAHFLAEHLASARRRGAPGRAAPSLVAAAFGVVRDYLRLRQLDGAYADWAAEPGDRAGDAPPGQ